MSDGTRNSRLGLLSFFLSSLNWFHSYTLKFSFNKQLLDLPQFTHLPVEEDRVAGWVLEIPKPLMILMAPKLVQKILLEDKIELLLTFTRDTFLIGPD